MADFVPCDRQLQKAYSLLTDLGQEGWQMVPRNLQVSKIFIQSRNLGTAFVMSLEVSFCEFP